MILLTRLDKTKLLINLDTVKYVESTPDTVITFVNGDSVIVRESLEELDRRVLEYRVRLLSDTRTKDVPSGT
jgi:flagellar protein FlbD